jgi:nucleoside-diphosphate kinase
MNFEGIHEKTLLIIKPDGVQRGLIGEVIRRLERKGLKIVGMKMLRLSEDLLREHYKEHVTKDFYPSLEAFMSSSPVVCICAEGLNAVGAVRLICGATNAAEADGGTIRGDLAMGFSNVVHCSDSLNGAKREVHLFFGEDVYDYDKTEYTHVYMDQERDLNV